MDLNFYINKFSNLSVKITDGQKKPNKAIMLLSVIDLIRCGYIKENQIPLDDTIEESFKRFWLMYVNEAVPSCWTPFWHLNKESFWHFKPKYSMEEVESLAKPGETASSGKMKRSIKYVFLDEDLFQLLKYNSTRSAFVECLKKNYLI